MRTVNAIAVAAVAVFGAASSAAAQGFPFPKTSGVFIQAPQPSKPVLPAPDKMREEAKEQALRALQSQVAPGARTVVCGMTVIPANPAVDPNSIKKAPNDRKYTMRSVPPGICTQDSSAATVVVPPSTVAPR
jgi:hypothetical protein